MKYLVKFYVKQEQTTGNLDYTLKVLKKSGHEYSKIETKEIKEFGETLTLVIAYEKHQQVVEASDEQKAYLSAVSNYVGIRSTEVISVTPVENEEVHEEEKEDGFKFMIEYSLLNPCPRKVVAQSYSDAVKKFELESGKKVTYIALVQDQDNVNFDCIQDAEAILFEMDANDCDEIVMKEGFGTETVFTREKVELFLKLQSSSLRINRKKALSGDYDAI